MIHLDALTFDEADEEFLFAGKIKETHQHFALRITKTNFTHQYLYLLDKFYFIKKKLKLQGMVFGIFYCYKPHVYKVMYADYTETKLYGNLQKSFDSKLQKCIEDMVDKIMSIKDKD
jgi:hypothetical protein